MADLTELRRHPADSLLHEITHCPLIPAAISSADHPCAAVVATQGGVPLVERQVPEPWTGHIADAVVLFVSSNPSISVREDYPTGQATDEELGEYFTERFGDAPGQIKDGIYGPLRTGGWARATSYWAHVKKRTSEVLSNPSPGWDYALTEAVHCKSRKEIGVESARETCSGRYLARTVRAAPWAGLLIIYGSHARQSFNDLFGISLDAERRHLVLNLDGFDRHVVYLDHPASGGKIKRLASALGESALQSLKGEISQLRYHRNRSSMAARYLAEDAAPLGKVEIVLASRGNTWARWTWVGGDLDHSDVSQLVADNIVPAPSVEGAPSESAPLLLGWLRTEGWRIIQHSGRQE